MTLNEALSHEAEIRIYIGYYIEQFNHRPAEYIYQDANGNPILDRDGKQKTAKWKRTPLDELRRHGKLTTEAIITEWNRIMKKESRMPHSMREAVVDIVYRAAQDYARQADIEKAKAEAEKAAQEAPKQDGGTDGQTTAENAAEAKETTKNAPKKTK